MLGWKEYKYMGQNIQKKFNNQQNKIRRCIMDFIILEKRPFHIQRDSDTFLKHLCISKDTYATDIECLKKKDGMVVDEEGYVNFIYPVSAFPTHHQVTLEDGRSFSAMCAIDAIGAAFTFHQNVEIHSECSVCGQAVYVKVEEGKIVKYTPNHLYALSFQLEELANWAGSC